MQHINPDLIDLGVSLADLVLHKIFYILLFLAVKVALQKHVKPVSTPKASLHNSLVLIPVITPGEYMFESPKEKSDKTHAITK